MIWIFSPVHYKIGTHKVCVTNVRMGWPLHKLFGFMFKEMKLVLTFPVAREGVLIWIWKLPCVLEEPSHSLFLILSEQSLDAVFQVRSGQTMPGNKLPSKGFHHMRIGAHIRYPHNKNQGATWQQQHAVLCLPASGTSRSGGSSRSTASTCAENFSIHPLSFSFSCFFIYHFAFLILSTCFCVFN